MDTSNITLRIFSLILPLGLGACQLDGDDGDLHFRDSEIGSEGGNDVSSDGGAYDESSGGGSTGPGTDTGCGGPSVSCEGGRSAFLQAPSPTVQGLGGSYEGWQRTDSFVIADGGAISQIRWFGGYIEQDWSGGAPPSHETFIVRIYADANGVPGSTIKTWAVANPAYILTDEVLHVGEGQDYPIYRHSFDLPEALQVNAGTRYWLSVITTSVEAPGWNWRYGDPADMSGLQAYGTQWWSEPEDLAFQLIMGDPCGPVCGDGVVNGMDQCDDGNIAVGDGCDDFCQIEGCGDGVINGMDQCDDGNLANNDGCSQFCLVEECGDGVVNGTEQCDDGDDDDDNGCGPTFCTFHVDTSLPDDFSYQVNGGASRWQYGYASDAANGPYGDLAPLSTVSNLGFNWSPLGSPTAVWNNGNGQPPFAGVNWTGQAQSYAGIAFPTGALLVHPPANGATILSWESDVSASVRIEMALTDADDDCGDGISYEVRYNNISLGGISFPNGGTSGLVTKYTHVWPGDRIHLVVSDGQNYACDSTLVSARIKTDYWWL